MNWFRSATRRDEDAQSTYDAQREDDDMCARAVVAIINSRQNIRRNPQPMHDSMLTGNEFIRPADYTTVQPFIIEHEGKFRPWFDGCIGAIDGTHVPCVPRRENADGWINRKGFHSQNILAACSFDMKFTYMLAGYEGSCHDARMLDEAIAYHGFPIPPPGRSDDVNEDYVLDEGIDDTGPSTGTDQHGSMNQLRERMADAMWERYQSYPWYRAT
ncbi:hypothetical protein TIFTF001_050686 [Ficus carica]|uniref:DDE Tnp4 domain-containing protein n=1 Tax=Ficus carica TaxID=3494 RepID=A0AA87Z714_FICCA|nr:hypothetical protein TIFTF001_050680 [Ficus carica]GMN30706.1 hypothetical protein TIFTF001_050682 [Ficus carica]GMN30728.1 hypothetical protein TIFTF001_050684 [Ficus carica]GMN30753.1 hypothetical protein TIFTF001_050686 [Ficus carica]